MDVHIMPMTTEEDIAGKAYVHWKSWHETYSELVDEEFMKTITLEKCEKIARRWPDHILVAKKSDKVIGFVGCGACRDDDLADCGEVFAIYVLADCHGQGIGYELMNAAFEKLADYREIAVWVLKGNEKAVRFYERYGFRFDGRSKKIMLGTLNTELRMICSRR